MPKGTHADDSVESNTNVTRRRFLAGAAVTGAALATGAGSAAAAGDPSDLNINYDSEYAHDPRITGSITVDLHRGKWDPLTHFANDGDVENLTETYGVTLRDEPDTDTEQPHNPVTINAADFVNTTEKDDGSMQVERLDEYAAFPRGVTYDDDGDSSTDEVPVSALDETHWTKDVSGVSTSGATLTVEDVNGGDSLHILADGFGSGDTGILRFTDFEITTGVDRKFLQLVKDVDELLSGTRVEFRIEDSTGAQAVTFIDSSGDTSTVECLANATGPAQVSQARAGELSTSLEDIQAIEIAVMDADTDLTLHGVNLERESEWSFGDYETTDADGNVVTETYTNPNGDVSITGLDTLTGPFASAGVQGLTYSIQQEASLLLDEDVMVRKKDAPSTYDYDHEIEIVKRFPDWSAYDLSTTLSDLLDDVELAPGRYGSVEVSTDAPDFDDWDAVEGHSWTSRTDTYTGSSVGSEVNVASVSTGSTPALRFKVYMNADEADDLLTTSSGGAVAASSGGGSGGAFGLTGIIAAVTTGLGALLAKVRGWI